MFTETGAFTPRDLAKMPDRKGLELRDGHLVGRHASSLSSWVGGEVFGRLAAWVDGEGLGTTWPAGLGLAIFPSSPCTVRRPAASFVRRDRGSWNEFAGDFLEVAPDLVVEVLSPSDLAVDVERKIEEYLGAGVRLIWVVDPDTRTVRVERRDGSAARLRQDQELSGEGVVPGFSCRVSDLFPPAAVPLT